MSPNVSTANPPRKGAIIRIGAFAIAELENGRIWITHKGGEGMAVKVERLEKVIDAFFKKEF